MAQRGIDLSDYTITFGPFIARRLKRRRPAPSSRLHLAEMICRIGGTRMYLCCAADDADGVIALVVQRR